MTESESRKEPRKPKVVAIASGGGRWVQLLRLRPAFDNCDVTFVTVRDSYRAHVGEAKFDVVPDSNRWDKIALVRTALSVIWLLIRLRPDVIVTTGAAPGYFAVHFGRWIGARTVWLDSIANAEKLSMSGRMVKNLADLWLTQWPHLSGNGGPRFTGNVL